MNSILQSPMASKKKLSESTANIRVAVRIRPINSNEKEDKCTNIVKVDHLKSSVTCRGKGFGPFFRVYDSETSQAEVYDDLVSSQIKKVIAGFNCTVFAYGQTGTGKTFTMEGGRTDATSSKDDETTGIIPRAVEDIFEQLEKTNCEEYSLRVSYVELYNEELFDLLAAYSEVEDRERLRIFDDPNKKGVIVSGVEEVPVRNRADVYKLLEIGAEKRKTAATLMNMRSSRSHSLFMVNVVVRENTIGGEELVKQGKLNLVDLAGSENIGRSGAQGNRAKEAGSINQSLLTLGRVIRSLTTNAQHIPYRESKLTRLLQDSLGGSTITSLIATLSPASSNFEESQSTLEYAMRAANIKNKPQCNSKVSKKTILKEYSDEIEKLRRDLRAAREKNGVIISQESHDEMQRNTERVHELEEQLDSVVDRLRRFTEDAIHMDEQYKKLYERKGKLEDRLRIKIREIAEREKELADTKDDLAKYISALESMHTSALQTFYQLKQMRNSADNMRRDLHNYWEKVDEMKEADERNSTIVEQLLKNIKEFVEKMEETTTKYVETNKEVSSSHFERFSQSAENVQTNSEKCWKNTEFINININKYSEALEELENSSAQEVSNLVSTAKKQLTKNITLFNQNCQLFSETALELVGKTHGDIVRISDKIDSFKQEIIPLIGELRETTEKDLTRRNEERQTMETFIKQKNAEIAESLKLALSVVEKIPQNMNEMMENCQLKDEESREKMITISSTIFDVVQSMEDEVNEATINKDEDKTNAESNLIKYRSYEKDTLNQINQEINETLNHIEENSSKFVQNSKNHHDNCSQIVNKFIEEEKVLNENQKQISQMINQTAVKAKNDAINNCEALNDSSREFVKNIRNVINSTNLIKIDPEENVPGRATAAVFTEDELYEVPEPESLVGEQFDNNADFEIKENEFMRKNRRVTGFMRRDSLLDTTNSFLSPSAIQRRREESIEEENEENI